MTGKLLAGFILALVLGFGLAKSSAAALITWSFEGQVDYISGDSDETLETLSSLGVSLGTSFSGQIVFESTTPDDDPDPLRGNYPGTISLFSVTLGSIHEELVTSPGVYSTIVVWNYVNSPAFLEAKFNGPYIDGIGGSPSLTLVIGESDPGQILGDAVPLFPPIPWSGDSTFVLSTLLSTGQVHIAGSLTEMAPVPEPSLFAFLIPLALATHFYRRSHP